MLQISQDVLDVMPLQKDLRVEGPDGNVFLSAEDVMNMAANQAAATGSFKHQ